MTARIAGLRLTAAGGALMICVIGTLVPGCQSNSAPTPSTSTTTTTTTYMTTTEPTTTAPAGPTEKSINPTGGNLFTPPPVAPASPAVPPGVHPGINGVP